MSDNPFWEPEDNERTVFARPVPGGRAAGPAPPAAPPQATPPPSFTSPPPLQAASTAAAAGEPLGSLVTGLSPLIAAAAPLLQLLGRIQNTFNPPNPADLRQRAVQAVRDYEKAASSTGLPREIVHPARYALCASIDDVVRHTPWGMSGAFAQAGLVATFHQENLSGEGFFYQLTALKREPARNLMLLELMYLCLSLGYQGEYRLSRRGPAQLEQVREDLYQTIVRLRQPYEQGLSPNWKGQAAPYRPACAMVPIWVMAVVAIAIVGVAWGVFSFRLSNAANQAYAAATTPLPSQMPRLERLAIVAPAPPRPPIAPAESAFNKRLHAFLEPEIKARLVVVTETPQAIDVQIFNRGMFASGSATVRDDFVSLLERIGDALNEESGHVLVTGHTDNQPIHTLRFPSNFQLSEARAQAASAIMERKLRDSARMTIQGRADTQPIASNDTPEGREQNRRIEVILQRQG